MIGIDDDQAVKMGVRTYEGIDFLIVEKGGFGGGPKDEGVDEIPADWHCGYHIYMRKQ